MLKGFVAWDEWAKNPGKALGMALTNVVATVVSGGAGCGLKTAALAGKFGAASKAVGEGRRGGGKGAGPEGWRCTTARSVR